MNEAAIAITVMSGLIAAIFLGFFIWGLATGQFKNVQEPSRRMLKNNVQNPVDIPQEENRENSRPGRAKGGNQK